MLGEWELIKWRGRVGEWSQVGEHLPRGGDCLCKGPVAEGTNIPSINLQEACVAGAQKPRGKAGLVEAGGVPEARPPRTLGAMVRLLIFVQIRGTHWGEVTWSDYHLKIIKSNYSIVIMCQKCLKSFVNINLVSSQHTLRKVLLSSSFYLWESRGTKRLYN